MHHMKIKRVLPRRQPTKYVRPNLTVHGESLNFGGAASIHGSGVRMC